MLREDSLFQDNSALVAREKERHCFIVVLPQRVEIHPVQGRGLENYAPLEEHDSRVIFHLFKTAHRRDVA